jgi:hypothetical protein
VEALLQPPKVELPRKEDRTVVIVTEDVLRRAVLGFANRPVADFTIENVKKSICAINSRRGAIAREGEESERSSRVNRLGLRTFEEVWTYQLIRQVRAKREARSVRGARRGEVCAEQSERARQGGRPPPDGRPARPLARAGG